MTLDARADVRIDDERSWLERKLDRPQGWVAASALSADTKDSLTSICRVLKQIVRTYSRPR